MVGDTGEECGFPQIQPALQKAPSSATVPAGSTVGLYFKIEAQTGLQVSPSYFGAVSNLEDVFFLWVKPGQGGCRRIL